MENHLIDVITNPIANIPINPKSHTHGWTMVWRDQLNAKIDHKCSTKVLSANTVYIDHGANFGGTLNLFGGATEELYNRLNIIAACNNVVSLDWDMPDFGAMLKKRIGAKTTYAGITESWCDALSKRFVNTPSLKQENLSYDSITLGDSHTIAFSGRNHRVFRNDGKTLFGSIKSSFDSMLRGATPIADVYLCFGSIDIRHHILRHDGFELSEFIREYVNRGKKLEQKYGCNVSYCAPVPVEFEGRRIPKTGYYKKTPFFGSLEERKTLTENFINELDKHSKGKIIVPPTEWYQMDPEKYANTYMEFGGSFHIAPPYYHRNDWGVTAIGA